MKKTTYILLILVALTFISQIAIGIYLWSHRITFEEYKARHPEYFNEHVTEYVEAVAEDEGELPDAYEVETAATVIDATDGGYRVRIFSESPHNVNISEDYYTDTLIITSAKKDIHVTKIVR